MQLQNAHGETWNRHDITITDGTTRLTLSLWNTPIETIEVGDCVLFQNMNTHIFNNITRLNSTDETLWQVSTHHFL